MVKNVKVKKVNKWIPELGLYESDRNVLLSSTEWITDAIVNAAQHLMREVNPVLPGLQDVALGLTMSFEIQRGKSVQILHTGHGHWNTIAATGEEPAHLQVYDSMHISLPTSEKVHIASILATSEPVITLDLMDVQMQSGSYNCGLFAMAFVNTSSKNQDLCTNYGFEIKALDFS